MEAYSHEPAPPRIAPPLPPPRLQPQPSAGGKWKKIFWPVIALGALLAKFKGLLLPFLKFFKFIPVILKTGGTMLLSIWAYSLYWGWQYAVGFVLLILVHECGHLLAAKRLGLKVGAPVFIPFMGAIIALKEAPKNAWIEAQVGIGGPLLGTVGAVACYGTFLLTDNPLFMALAYTGFFLNLFNLAPVGFLDGGRIVTALSPWLWIIGMAIVVFLLITHFNFILLLIVLFSLPRLFSLFRKKTEEELRYFEVTPAQRWLIGGLYFGLVAFLVVGMNLAHFIPAGQRGN
ncbi:MAG: site-2 protease family protein [Verrucomicrobia bacterium]|nr:MAG: site-2 protease family protein [Verrucomicrobiota bacterium]